MSESTVLTPILVPGNRFPNVPLLTTGALWILAMGEEVFHWSSHFDGPFSWLYLRDFLQIWCCWSIAVSF